MNLTLCLIADLHYMYASVDGCIWRKYNTMPYLHSHPVTILLYGEILLLGMESGKLYDDRRCVCLVCIIFKHKTQCVLVSSVMLRFICHYNKVFIGWCNRVQYTKSETLFSM